MPGGKCNSLAATRERIPNNDQAQGRRESELNAASVALLGSLKFVRRSGRFRWGYNNCCCFDGLDSSVNSHAGRFGVKTTLITTSNSRPQYLHLN